VSCVVQCCYLKIFYSNNNSITHNYYATTFFLSRKPCCYLNMAYIFIECIRWVLILFGWLNVPKDKHVCNIGIFLKYDYPYRKIISIFEQSKSDTMTSMWVGISVQGVLISEQDTVGSRRVICRHAWNDTQKVSYNRRRFSIQPKPDPNIGKLPKLNFFTETYKMWVWFDCLLSCRQMFIFLPPA